MRVLLLLLLWVSHDRLTEADEVTTIAAQAAASSGTHCFKDLSIGNLKAFSKNTGWNNFAKAIMRIFVPKSFTNENVKEYGQIIDLEKGEIQMGKLLSAVFGAKGLLTLLVLGIILSVLYCACCVTLNVFYYKKKHFLKPLKKKPPVALAYTGLGLTSTALLFCFIATILSLTSVMSLTDGIVNLGPSLEPVSKGLYTFVKGVLDQIKCTAQMLTSSSDTEVKKIPKKMKELAQADPNYAIISKIDFNKMGSDVENYGSRAKAISTKLATEGNGNGAITPIKNSLDQIQQLLHGDTQNPEGIKQKVDKLTGKNAASTPQGFEAQILDLIAKNLPELNDIGKLLDTELNKLMEKLDGSALQAVEDLGNKLKGTTKPLKPLSTFGPFLILLLFPCWAAMVSSGFACTKLVFFLLKKKVTLKWEKMFFVPLTVGLGCAFIPLLVATGTAIGSGLGNMACGSIFETHIKEITALVPKEMTGAATIPIDATRNVSFYFFEALEQCHDGKPFFASFGLVPIFTSLLTAQVKVDKIDAKLKMSTAYQTTSFHFADATDYTAIETPVNQLSGTVTALEVMIAAAKPSAQGGLLTTVTEAETLVNEIKAFSTKAQTDLAAAKRFDPIALKASMKPQIDTLIDQLATQMEQKREAFIKDFSENSASCKWFFDMFRSAGPVFCEQALGGVNGIYAAFGLAVLTIIGAFFGVYITFMFLSAELSPEAQSGSGGGKAGSKKGGKGSKKDAANEKTALDPTMCADAGLATGIAAGGPDAGAAAAAAAAPAAPTAAAVNPKKPEPEKSDPFISKEYPVK